MRLFFVFLLILNLLYAGWNYLQPVESSSTVRPLPAGLNSLHLLSESDMDSDQQLSATEPHEEPVAQTSVKVEAESDTETQPKAMCFTLGPFKDESIMLQVRDALAENARDILVHKREESERHRYWVHMPPLGGRAQARAMSKQLASKKIKDFYIVRSGENNNSVSLGHYRERKHADRRIDNLKKHGVDASMKVIYRHYNVYWLDYSVDVEQAENDEFVQKFLIDGVTRLDRECK